jgi:glycosyltransferase involved in cell wall biosynthesis
MVRRIAVVLKGYPRLSETFIAQELLGLERSGLSLHLFSLRQPTDSKRHPVHDEIKAKVDYLPEYLHDNPGRVWRAWLKARRLPGYKAARTQFLADFKRDIAPNRARRFGQALVLAAEMPAGIEWLHAHFIHTPASVTRYAAIMRGMKWTCSAHAKDIWTSKDWDLRGKLAEAQWTVTCTQSGHAHLQSLAADPKRVHLSYHGLDLDRFAAFNVPPATRDGSDAENPARIVSVGRAVEKKGYDVLLDALARLPKTLHWRFVHIGGGELLPALEAQADKLGIAKRIEWRGSQAQDSVLSEYRKSDIFALACRIAPDGDRDGLPNVLVEASSQNMACVSTNISGVPELITDDETGLLVPPEKPDQFAAALARLIGDPELRFRLGAAAEAKVRAEFDYRKSIAFLADLFAKA